MFIGGPRHLQSTQLYRAPPMENRLYVGTPPIELPEGGFFYMGDDVPLIDRARYFDYREHSFNLLKQLDYRKICDIVAVFEALFVVTGGTLTESTGLDFIAERLDHADDTTTMVNLIPPPDKKSTSGEIWAYSKMQRLMRSPILRRMLCEPTNFSFSPRSKIFCRLNRAEMGEWDALAVALFLIAQTKSSVVLPDFGFYGRDFHTALIREQRLIAGVRSLKTIGRKYPDLMDELLLLDNKTVAGALHDDAVEIAKLKGFIPGTIEYNEDITKSMAPPEPAPAHALWVPPPMKERMRPKPVPVLPVRRELRRPLH